MMTHVQMLRPDPVLAEISFGGIIYMIAIFFWVVSRLFGKKKTQPAESMPSPSSPRPVDVEMKELFETLTGQKLAPNRPPPPPEPAPVAAKPRPVPVRHAPRPPRAAPAPSRTPAPARAAPVAPPPLLAWQAETVERDAGRPAVTIVSAPTLSYAMRSNSGRMSAMKLPIVRLGMGSASNSGAASHMLDALRNPDGIRAAMVQRVVLGPPRAFDPA